ncbi:glycerophosphoinositol inositolphosphodiesterase GDPD2 isoform X1 [Pleurodeles waltl]|uniref:glycerophosphoinositol inositolphosphodiesterase GDPD2 isoform X1 n=1 Tax=Pleurodeles waltl TaxID=8319 RepID=UPI003709577B
MVSCGCRQLCVTCFRGFHNCQWKESKEKQKTSKCDGFWFLLLLAIVVFTLAWLYVSLIVLNDMHSFNEHIFRTQSLWLDWTIVFIVVASVLVTYSSLLLVLSAGVMFCGQPLKMHWFHKILLALTAAIIIAGFVGLDIKWHEEWTSLYVSFQATAPFLHIGAVVGVTLLAWIVADRFFRTESKGLKALMLLCYICVVIALYLAPLLIRSPCIMEPNQLPNKPRLMGHRGAPMVAPENTMMSFQKTVDCGASVFESDVMVSMDGVPFLMHDDKLTRTTNVAQVFPDRAQENCSWFSWQELQQLNAGEWFLQRPPFTIESSLSTVNRNEVLKQKIPSLEELLRSAGDHNMSVMFDLRPPHERHPYNQTYVNVTVDTILKSNIRQDLILWLPDDFREEVKLMAPGFQQIYGRRRSWNDTEPLMKVNLSFKNLSTEEIRAYRQDNVSVNIFVVNKPWLFSILWCAGVDSITTNACHILKDMDGPSWLISPDTYLMIWVVTDGVSFLLIVWAFVLRRKCCKRDSAAGNLSYWPQRGSSIGAETAVLLTQIHNIAA